MLKNTWQRRYLLSKNVVEDYGKDGIFLNFKKTTMTWEEACKEAYKKEIEEK